MLCHIIFLYLSSNLGVLARIQILNPFSFEINQCKDICSDSFFLLPSVEDSQNICQRGCRFFNIIDIKDGQSLNDTTKECHTSCSESYANEIAKNSCIIGCDTMSKKKQSDVNKFFPYLEHYNVDDQEIDSLEVDILLDPLIRKQVQMGCDLQYKIPEAYIRTMPIDVNNIELVDNNIPFKEYKNNIICSLFPFSILVILLVVLLLCIFKIIRLLDFLNDHSTERAQEELNKIILKCNDEEGKCFLHNYKHFKYNLYEIPGLAFVISLSRQKEIPEENLLENSIVAQS